MTVYRLFLAVDVAALLLALYFFFIGIRDGSVSSFNIILWLALLGGAIAIIGAGYTLKARGQARTATGVLTLLGLPVLLAGLFALSLLIFQPNWN